MYEQIDFALIIELDFFLLFHSISMVLFLEMHYLSFIRFIVFQSQIAQADHWFAWQRINGVTRNLIKRVDEVPEQ